MSLWPYWAQEIWLHCLQTLLLPRVESHLKMVLPCRRQENWQNYWEWWHLDQTVPKLVSLLNFQLLEPKKKKRRRIFFLFPYLFNLVWVYLLKHAKIPKWYRKRLLENYLHNTTFKLWSIWLLRTDCCFFPNPPYPLLLGLIGILTHLCLSPWSSLCPHFWCDILITLLLGYQRTLLIPLESYLLHAHWIVSTPLCPPDLL